MKILFIFTGGTIGSTLNGDYITTEQSKAYGIISAYQKKHGINFDYDVVEPYTELSENNTGLNIKNLAKCVKENKVLEDLSLAEFKEFNQEFEQDLYEEISLETCVNKRVSEGGTSPDSVQKQIELLKEFLLGIC